MTRICLVLLFHSGNVLAALSAVKWYSYKQYTFEDCKIVTIINVPGIPRKELQITADIIEKMTSVHGWEKPVILSDNDIAIILQKGYLTSCKTQLKRFREYLGLERVDEIYYAHDVIGDIPRLAMNCYPEALRITFGDALGCVYDKKLHITLAQGTKQTVIVKIKFQFQKKCHTIRNSLRHFFLGRLNYLQASIAVLILPMDQTGLCLKDIVLHVVPKNIVQEIISHCLKAIPELDEYSRQILSVSPKPCFIFLLENFSEGNFTTMENEVNLYKNIIYKHVPLGATILIKKHPLSKMDTAELLVSHLGIDYNTRVISEPHSKYPIELWQKLVRECQIISFSYPAVSLQYLYDKKIIYPMNRTLIEKYINPAFWDSYFNADQMYRGQMENLSTWDRNSILWRGHCVLSHEN